jgi:hypothetical protein
MESLNQAAQELFDWNLYDDGLDPPVPNFKLQGFLKKAGTVFDFTEEPLEVGPDVTVIMVPRFSSVTFQVMSWRQADSRDAIVHLCKDMHIVGNVTRHSINSISAKLSHPDRSALEEAVARLANIFAELGGAIGEQNWEYNYGQLENAVRKHRGTAHRTDGIPSFDGDDAISNSTFFNP